MDTALSRTEAAVQAAIEAHRRTVTLAVDDVTELLDAICDEPSTAAVERALRLVRDGE